MALVYLNKATDDCIAAKLQSLQPCSSVKERIWYNIIIDAEKGFTVPGKMRGGRLGLRPWCLLLAPLPCSSVGLFDIGYKIGMPQNFCASVEYDGDPTVVSTFLHLSHEGGCWRDLVVIIGMVSDFVMWAAVALLMLSIGYNLSMNCLQHSVEPIDR